MFFVEPILCCQSEPLKGQDFLEDLDTSCGFAVYKCWPTRVKYFYKLLQSKNTVSFQMEERVDRSMEQEWVNQSTKQGRLYQ